MEFYNEMLKWWNFNPKERPTMKVVYILLNNFSGGKTARSSSPNLEQDNNNLMQFPRFFIEEPIKKKYFRRE